MTAFISKTSRTLPAGLLPALTIALTTSCGLVDAGDRQPAAPLRTTVVRAVDAPNTSGRRVQYRPKRADGPLTCDSPGLVWQSASKTHYTSYPAPGSEECIKYSGCKYQGLFSACGDQRKSQEWVKAHNIAAFFPLGDMALHNICIRSTGGKTMEVTVYDTCGDHDCNGCCTRNKGRADALIDLEKFTNARFGVRDGAIQWADLGIKGATCSD
jgi:hypothetical protein